MYPWQKVKHQFSVAAMKEAASARSPDGLEFMPPLYFWEKDYEPHNVGYWTIKRRGAKINVVYAAKQATCCGVLEFGAFPTFSMLTNLGVEPIHHVTFFAELLRMAIDTNEINLVLSTTSSDVAHMPEILKGIGFKAVLETCNPKSNNYITLWKLHLDERR